MDDEGMELKRWIVVLEIIGSKDADPNSKPVASWTEDYFGRMKLEGEGVALIAVKEVPV